MSEVNRVIDWPAISFSALWILGLSIGLTAVCFAHYRGGEEKRKLGQVLGEKNIQVVLDLSMTLFSLGFMGSAYEVWERVGWGIVALAFGVQTWMAWRRN